VRGVSPSRRGWIPACRKTGEDYVKLLFLLLLTLLATHSAKAQALPEYYMSNATVTDCKGILFDSDAGQSGDYAQSENFTFTICPGLGSTVQLWFNGPFCTENGFDFISFYNGPNTNSPLIGTFSGNTAPPTILANSGCLTIKFTSDANVTCGGWEAQWRTIIPPILPPLVTATVPPCNTNSFTLTFDTVIRCNTVLPQNITVTGLTTLQVASVTPINCQNNLATQFLVALAQPITQSCNYQVAAEVGIPDVCDSIWNFTPSTTFLVNTCPFNVTVTATEDTICPGQCTQIKANVTGCLGYNFTWSNGLPNSAGPFTVCPGVTTTYSVNVQTQQGGPIVPGSITVHVLSPTINSVQPLTVCQSDAPFVLTASPAGGEWSGPGITDEDLGVFDPDTSGPGSFYIKYELGSCADSILITIKPMDAGLDQAACPGAAPFAMEGFSPPGGTWAGQGITVGGLYTPPVTADTAVVTYTFNGCTDFLTIYTANIQFTAPFDTICQSADTFSIGVYPPGGRWYGAGIIDSLRGTFDPDDAGGGMHALTYQLNGCSITYNLYVKPIDAFWNLASCPAQTFYQLPAGSPAGGVWSGLGVVDGVTGAYNPSFFTGTYNEDDLTYTHPNGCSDQVTMYIVQTAIYRDTVYRCVDESRIWLRWESVQSTPWNGTWTGPGTYFSPANGGRWYYDPAIAGPGEHTLVYTANTCIDSMVMIVYGPLQNTTISVCELDQPFVLEDIPFGATWQGSGIINPITGLFDPTVANNDTVWVKYDTPRGCADSMQVFITPFQQADITGLNASYCNIDTLIPLTITPPGGTLTGSGLVGTDFNPSLLVGGGQSTLLYTFGTGNCQSTDSIKVAVFPHLTASITANNDSLCFGLGTGMQAIANGGNQGLYTYQWSDNMGVFQNVAVSPTQTTTYYVTVADGCSDAVTDSITITVFPQYSLQLSTSSIDCYGQDGFATANITGNSSYSFLWNVNPPVTSPTLNAPVGGNYFLTVTDEQSGCELDTLVNIPGYGVLTALFSANPNLECIPYNQNLVTFIDLSTGADSGRWFVNGIDSLPYINGQNPFMQFEQHGNYDIMLVVYNQGGCVDTFRVPICILEPLTLFIPNSFTPNFDGVNDVFYAVGQGVVEFEMNIYTRQNQLIFTSTDMTVGWDGFYKDLVVPNGVYAYVINAKFNSGQKFFKGGTVTVIR
jgi:gliding motility-associated-like protein